ncbi:MAG: reverse transcriptase family protein [Planctomycetota bacterium]
MNWIVRIATYALVAMLVIPFLLLALVLSPVAIPLILLARFNRRHAHGHPRHWLRAKFGRGLGVAELARRLQVEEVDLRKLEPYYRKERIPKRRGGERELHVPDRETKELQRRILHLLLAKLRTHDSCCGFEPGRSIVHNALPHVGRAVVVRMDIVDFFPATSSERVEAYFRRVGWNREAARLLTRLCTWQGGLPQGAPTSPRLANLVNYRLDVALARLAARGRGSYTRYADDLTFSFPVDRPKRVRGLIQRTRGSLRTLGYELHEREKLHIRRSHQRQVVTGLVVNEKVQLTRERRRWLRAIKHRLATGRDVTLSDSSLQGWLALDSMIEQQAGAAVPNESDA